LITASKYKLICSLAAPVCWIENKENGKLTEPFNLEDVYISKMGMAEDLSIVYGFTVCIKE